MVMGYLPNEIVVSDEDFVDLARNDNIEKDGGWHWG